MNSQIFQLFFFLCSQRSWRLLVLVLYNVQPLSYQLRLLLLPRHSEVCVIFSMYVLPVWLSFLKKKLNSMRATLHLWCVRIFQCVFNVMLKKKKSTNKCMFSQTDTLVEGDTFYTHTLDLLYLTVFIFVHPAVKVSVWKVFLFFSLLCGKLFDVIPVCISGF